VDRVRRADGTNVYVVRWYDAGRRGRRRQRSFDRRSDAEFFEASIRRARQLGQLGSELLGSEQTLESFIGEWWDKYALAVLSPGSLSSYAYMIDRWITPYLGAYRLRELTREAIDAYRASILAAGAGAPTVNRSLAILQGVLRRAVEWRCMPANPVAGAARVRHVRDTAIDARTPETVEAIRANLERRDATLVSVLAYIGLRPAEALALQWRDVLDEQGKPRTRLRVQRALSGGRVSTTKSRRGREPELFVPIARDLAELYLAQGRPASDSLVFPDASGGYICRQNWRQRVWVPALRAAAVAYFRPYDLRHTCATLLIYEGRPIHEVAEHLGHADPGFTLRVYAHTFSDASRRRRVPIARAIVDARRRVVDVRAENGGLQGLAQKDEAPANQREPTPGLEPGTPSLRVKCSTS
jgi:integrase